MGSAALALAFVAKGALDCVQMDSLQPWDVAAAVLIIREAGGTVIDIKGTLIKLTRKKKKKKKYKFFKTIIFIMRIH